MTATTEFVVPKSIPIIFPINLCNASAALVSTRPLSKFSALLSSSFALFLAAILSTAWAQSPGEILVAAAADLEPLQYQLSESFAKTGACRARFTFAASGVLARQIENGAPYDVFLSANESFIKELQAAGRLRPETVRLYAEGRLGLWSRSGQVRSLDDLLRPEVRRVALANPQHAPYGIAAREALKKKGLWEKLQPKIVYGENVQQTFQFARTGNADAALLSWTLVFDKGGVPVPASLYTPIRQSGAVVAGHRNPDCARRFMEFLTSAAGKTVLARFGLR